ncbi:glycerophosphodiester phosphodiesterase family protein [Nitrosophilus kaiyonis]|uniref:glycerophosphodiester phosphodiesterase family protein n=1 Tax=Nitrosophilus kaiyonis TaxID=2930200 RepID=UPI00249093D0|nr:glycerophosphodiester phosphodiesterase family protein [Nitrosophilus kaiyonis]
MDLGYSVEFDVRLTKDERIVVFHDKSLKRVCNKNKIIEFTKYSDLKKFNLFNTNEKIPLLKDIIKLKNRKTFMFIEIKEKKRSFLYLLRKIINHKNKIFLISKNNIIKYVKFNKKGYIFGEEKLLNIIKLKKEIRKINPDFLIVHKSKIIKIKKIFKNQYPLIIWTVKNQKELKKYELFYDFVIFEDLLNQRFSKTSNLFINYKNIIN